MIKQLGVTLGTVHNVISVNQSKWMEPYILGNNKVRTHASIDNKCLVDLLSRWTTQCLARRAKMSEVEWSYI